MMIGIMMIGIMPSVGLLSVTFA
jgi:hypothetical protein